MYITLSEAKQHLIIDSSFTADDEYILALIDVAEDAVSKNINIALENLSVGGEIPPAVKAAILLLVGNLYANREPVSYASVNKVPYTFDYLLKKKKNYSIL